jgi:thiamine-monophosphate kinase
MRLFNLGEKKIIGELEKRLSVGDDAAWLKFGGDFLIFSTDMIYEKTHFLPGMSYEEIGKLAVTINLSDIAAMGAKPLAFLLSCGTPADFKMENFREIIQGVEKQCKKFEMKFAGGDMNETDELILAGSILGFTKRKPILRSGARCGDVLCVTGNLGTASLGVDILVKKLPCKDDEVLKKALEPEPRVKEGAILGKFANSMTDISDSLAMSLYDIVDKSNGVGIEICLDKLPLAKSAINLANTLQLSIMDYALYGGWDYELLFTISEEYIDELRGAIDFTVIGKITKKKCRDDEGVTGVGKGKKIKIKRNGYEHFKKEGRSGKKHGKSWKKAEKRNLKDFYLYKTNKVTKSNENI